ncbi:hypothetical protein WN943_003604 [Citrus x changshan-huyou]
MQEVHQLEAPNTRKIRCCNDDLSNARHATPFKKILTPNANWLSAIGILVHCLFTNKYSLEVQSQSQYDMNQGDSI